VARRIRLTQGPSNDENDLTVDGRRKTEDGNGAAKPRLKQIA